MKRQPSAGNSLFVCQLKCTSDQLSAVTQADSVRNDFPRKQIDNHADIVIPVFDEKTGEVKDIMEESIILESIVKPISINRIYAEKEIADEVLTRIKELQSA